MKIALVHDHLVGKGGAERVFQYLCEEFSDADIYTVAYNPKGTYDAFLNFKIHTTWLNKFVQSMESFRWSFPIATYVMQAIDLKDYDIVLSSSTTVAKYVKIPNGIHICYCYMPARALWQSESYFGESIKGKIMKIFLSYFKKRDFNAAQKVDEFIAISNMTKEYIYSFYKRESQVIYSPIDLTKFSPKGTKKNHFLIVSRLERWKKIDFAIEAFNKLGLLLRIIGTGTDEMRLKEMSKSNISFNG